MVRLSGPMIYDDMSSMFDSTEQALQQWDLTVLITDLIRRHGYSPLLAEEAVREYRRYLLLRLHSLPEEIPLYSDAIDHAWHSHILRTEEYQAFCDQIFGVYLHHRPYDSDEWVRRLPEYEKTLSRYRNFFGEEPPACWNVQKH